MNRDKGNMALTYALVFGAVLALCGMAVRFWWGSPYAGITQLGIREVIPPVWLMGLLWLLWYFVLGATLGGVLYTYGKNCIGAWRGACFFLLMIGVGYLWYPLFFVRQNLALSLAVILAVIVLAAVCALQWQTLSVLAGAVLWLHVLWLIYMLILQLICLFGV
ncbi:MAG: tryptophan-rich sensory protein [Clostridia bacterium]|nr:tryptophan-rich sensory protein [Clostridia bacterium]